MPPSAFGPAIRLTFIVSVTVIAVNAAAQKRIACPDGEHIQMDVKKISIQYDGNSFAGTLNGLGALGARMQVEPKRVREAAEATQQWDVFLKGLAEGYNTCAVTRQQFNEALTRIYPRLKEDAAGLEVIRKAIADGQKVEIKAFRRLLDSYWSNLNQFAELSAQANEAVAQQLEQLRGGQEAVAQQLEQLRSGQKELSDQQKNDTARILSKIDELKNQTPQAHLFSPKEFGGQLGASQGYGAPPDPCLN